MQDEGRIGIGSRQLTSGDTRIGDTRVGDSFDRQEVANTMAHSRSSPLSTLSLGLPYSSLHSHSHSASFDALSAISTKIVLAAHIWLSAPCVPYLVSPLFELGASESPSTISVLASPHKTGPRARTISFARDMQASKKQLSHAFTACFVSVVMRYFKKRGFLRGSSLLTLWRMGLGLSMARKQTKATTPKNSRYRRSCPK